MTSKRIWFATLSAMIATLAAFGLLLRHDVSFRSAFPELVIFFGLAFAAAGVFSFIVYGPQRKGGKAVWAAVGAFLPIALIVILSTYMFIDSIVAYGFRENTTLNDLLDLWAIALLMFGWLAVPGAVIGLILRRYLGKGN